MRTWKKKNKKKKNSQVWYTDYLLLDSAPNIGPLISRWELDNSKIAETKALEPLES